MLSLILHQHGVLFRLFRSLISSNNVLHFPEYKFSTSSPPSPRTGSCYVAQAGLELMILLPQSSENWDYRCTPPLMLVFYFFLFFCSSGV
jgi:hypothetical protein